MSNASTQQRGKILFAEISDAHAFVRKLMDRAREWGVEHVEITEDHGVIFQTADSWCNTLDIGFTIDAYGGKVDRYNDYPLVKPANVAAVITRGKLLPSGGGGYRMAWQWNYSITWLGHKWTHGTHLASARSYAKKLGAPRVVEAWKEAA